jgi:hypothetical protein
MSYEQNGEKRICNITGCGTSLAQDHIDSDLCSLHQFRLRGRSLWDDETVERRVSDEWHIPASIELDKGRLVWNPDLALGNVQRPGPGMLTQFVALADGDADKTLRYAQQWGVLGICRHNVPASHNLPLLIGKRTKGCSPPRAANRSMCWEPLRVWWNFSRQALAILRIADHLRAGVPGSREDWKVVYQVAATYHVDWEKESDLAVVRMLDRGTDQIWPLQTIGRQRSCVVSFVNEWIGMGDVRLYVTWGELGEPGEQQGIKLGGDWAYCGLFGALAVQLALAVGGSGTEKTAVCAACGKPYQCKISPKEGQRNFCKACGKTASNRLRMREKRQAAKSNRRGGKDERLD